APHERPDNGRVWRIENYEPVDAIRPSARQVPSHQPTPVVANQSESGEISTVCERQHIPCELVDRVSFDALGLFAQVVASLVRRNDPIARTGERLDLMPPPPPDLRQAMQQNVRPAVLRTGFDHMPRDPVRHGRQTRASPLRIGPRRLLGAIDQLKGPPFPRSWPRAAPFARRT